MIDGAHANGLRPSLPSAVAREAPTAVGPCRSPGDRRPSPVIVDTCVLVAGLPTSRGPGPWARIVDGMRAGSIEFVTSDALVREYRGVLARPAIASRLRLGEGGVEALLDDLCRAAHRHTPAPPVALGRPAPDPGDAHLWALLQSDECLRLLTLDRRLLVFSRMRRRVITPDAWWRDHGSVDP